jgi:hypothetical protein
MATKITLLLILAFTTFCALGQDKIPNGYITAPTLSITGDFDGDVKPDILTQFIADSTGHPVKYIEDIAGKTWDDYVYNFGNKGNYTAITLTAVPIPLSLSMHRVCTCWLTWATSTKPKATKLL